MNAGYGLYGSRSLSSLCCGGSRRGGLQSLQRSRSHMGSGLSECSASSQTILYTVVGLVFQTGSNNRNGSTVGLGLIIHGTEDNIYIVSCQLLNIACRIGSICQGNVAGNIDDNMGSTGNRSL